MITKSWRAAALALPVLLLAPALAAAQALPDARAVLARYVEVTGAAKVAAAPGVRTVGTFELAAAGISGQLEALVARDGRTLTVISIPGVGNITQGTEPDFGWAMDPFQGPRLIEGAEFAQLKEQQDPKGQLRDPSIVTSATTVERTTMDGQACVKLKLVWKSGRESTECYSEETGLLIASESVQKSPMGDIPAVTLFRDYKDFDGTKSATKVVQQVMGQEQVLTMTAMEFGPIPAEKFVVPAEVKALRK
jgi:hypothetical protein